MISRQHVRQFLAVVDTGSFSRGANHIGVTQPTLSAGIAELERQIGARLFVRDRRAIRLTPVGNRLLDSARSIDREFRSLESAGGEVSVQQEQFRLGIVASLPTAMIEAVVRAMPNRELLSLSHGQHGELRSRFLDGKLDAMISLQNESDAQDGMTLFSEHYRMLLPTDHALAGREWLEPLELIGETMIARRSCEILSDTSRFFTQRGIRPFFGLRSANEELCLAMVASGLGITSGPESLVREGIVGIPLVGYNFRRTIALFFSDSTDMDREDVRALIAACRQFPVPEGGTT